MRDEIVDCLILLAVLIPGRRLRLRRVALPGLICHAPLGRKTLTLHGDASLQSQLPSSRPGLNEDKIHTGVALRVLAKQVVRIKSACVRRWRVLGTTGVGFYISAVWVIGIESGT